MKVVTPNQGNGRSYPPPPIPLEIPSTEEQKLAKAQYAKVSLLSNPGDQNSDEKFTIEFPYFNHGSPRELLDWFNNLDQVIRGQHITTRPAHYSMARALLRREGLQVFNAAATQCSNETVEHFKLVGDDLKKHFFPLKALMKQKRYMRRFLRKPRELTSKEYQAALHTLNGYLEKFPGADENSKLSNEELLEILEFGIPTTWSKEMTRQGFDPQDKGLPAFLEFLERMEVTDELPDPSGPKSKDKPPRKDKSNNPTNGRDGNDRKGNKGKRKYCKIHKNNSHDTSECRALDKYIDQHQKDGGKEEQPKHKRPRYNKYDKQELNAIAVQVKELMTKDSSNKNKRKRSDNDENTSDTDTDVEQRYNFNFDTLSIDSDEE